MKITDGKPCRCKIAPYLEEIFFVLLLDYSFIKLLESKLKSLGKVRILLTPMGARKQETCGAASWDLRKFKGKLKEN